VKVTIVEPRGPAPKPGVKFPCLMKNLEGCIAYASGPTAGTILATGDNHAGRRSYTERDGTQPWLLCGFTPMRGKVTIEFDMEDGQ